ncbi:MAG: glycosyltransferase family 39 protein [Methylococcales bacterium]|nr:glycosyltransferase family 39 protein [Methylococcales bacterium]
MLRSSTVYGIALVMGLCAAIVAYFLPVFPYTPDSACYLEQARSLLARGVFESGYYGTNDPTASYVPDPLFPPGYPVLIALFSLLVPAPLELVALFLSLVALVLVPSSVVFSFRRLLGDYTVLIIGLLLVSTPAIIRWGNVASTDVISMALVIFCMGLVLRAGERLRAWCVIGLLLGFAYLLRNANLAFVASIGGLLLWSIIFDAENRRQKLIAAGVWGLSFLVVVIPWMIRNFLVFGKIQPYSMPPSTVGFIENTHAFIEAQLNILWLLADTDTFLARHWLGLVIVAGVLGLLVWRGVKTWKSWPKPDQSALVITVLYCAMGAAIVIAARSKYQWGELISERHAFPYLFSLLVALALILKNAVPSIDKAKWGLALAGILLVLRVSAIPELYAYHFYDADLVAVVKHIKAHKQTDTICSHLNGRLGISNYGFVYRVICAVPARHIFPILHDNVLQDEQIKKLLDLKLGQGIVLTMYPNHDIHKANLPLDQNIQDHFKASGWKIEENGEMGFTLTR